MTKRTPPYSPEIRARVVRMVRDHQGEHASQRAAISSIAAKIGCSGEILRNRIRQAERDKGSRAGPTTDERERIKALEREVRELRQANEILRKASAFSAIRRGSRKPGKYDPLRTAVFAPAELHQTLGHDPGPLAKTLPSSRREGRT